MVMNKSFDYRKAASAIAMALLVVSVSFSCMTGAEGTVPKKSGSADLTDNGNGTASARRSSRPYRRWTISSPRAT
ncbi:hypothetical protein [Methanomassiliicoccus luminyensis]|uniref:hypothetical protein n=1 Tax=Methanomassiliicoccus luminyensis TaxID=1080712 RepID=UPI0011CC4725|nr:hypothetical protein [Methanomassiliicoccus luminyensis]